MTRRPAGSSRRAQNAARVLPFAAAALITLPLLWREAGASTTGVLSYIFGLWACLILAVAALSQRLRRDDG